MRPCTIKPFLSREKRYRALSCYSILQVTENWARPETKATQVLIAKLLGWGSYNTAWHLAFSLFQMNKTDLHKGDRVGRSVTFGVQQLRWGILTLVLELQQKVSVVCRSFWMGGLGALRGRGHWVTRDQRREQLESCFDWSIIQLPSMGGLVFVSSAAGFGTVFSGLAG